MSIVKQNNIIPMPIVSPSRKKVNKTVYQHIQTFLNDQRSKNTYIPYSRNITTFFSWFKPNKSLLELTVEDLDITNDEFKDYRVYLKNHPIDYANVSINTMIAAVQSLYAHFETSQLPVRAAWVSLKALPDDSTRTGSLLLSEAQKMAELVLETPKGFEKSVFIEMSYTTSFRKESLLELQMNQIQKNIFNENVYNVEVVGKGSKKHLIYITKELYEKLVQVSQIPYRQKKNDGKIFGLSKTTIQSMMDWLRAEMDFAPERNIKFHSFRNVATTLGTLEEAKAHLNHSNIEITSRSYRHNNPDFEHSLSLRMSEEISDSVFQELSKDQLIQLILQQQNGVILKMKKEAKLKLN